MAASPAGKGGGAAMPLAGIYELSGRPNISKAGDLSQATWDSATCKALVERPKKQLAVMGHWVSGWGVAVSEGGAQRKMLALFPEEMLLLVEQGLLLLRLPESTRVLSVVEAQALALSSAHVCPLYFEAYAHARDLGLVALRLEILPSLKCAIKPAFRGRPMLALWSAERGYCKGWRQSSPDHILVTSRACESLPSRSEWEQIDELASLVGATVKMAVVDGTGCPVMFDCCRSFVCVHEKEWALVRIARLYSLLFTLTQNCAFVLGTDFVDNIT